MPTMFFSESLAEHLNKACDLEIKVAKEGEILKPGRVYLAPAGCQTRIDADIDADSRGYQRSSASLSAFISVIEAEPDSLTPSIDMTMKSVAQTHNGNTMGVILSGMGDDGQEGMKAIKESGGKTIVQDESSLIFGMPKAVIEAGYADKVLSAEKIADAMMEYVS